MSEKTLFKHPLGLRNCTRFDRAKVLQRGLRCGLDRVVKRPNKLVDIPCESLIKEGLTISELIAITRKKSRQKRYR